MDHREEKRDYANGEWFAEVSVAPLPEKPVHQCKSSGSSVKKRQACIHSRNALEKNKDPSNREITDFSQDRNIEKSSEFFSHVLARFVPSAVGAEKTVGDTNANSRLKNYQESTIRVKGFLSFGARSSGVKHTFSSDAEKWVDRVEEVCDPVAFHAYWPTYADMTPEQMRWYFYWRSQLREGKFLRCDLSYLFVYFYEIINEVGWSEPAKGFAMLMTVWKAYRVCAPELDSYLVDWGFDFCMLHVPEQLHQFHNFLIDEQVVCHDVVYDAVLEQLLYKQPVQLDFYWIVRSYSGYWINNPFQVAHKEELEKYLISLLIGIDRYLEKMQKKRLAQIVEEPSLKRVSRASYRSAVYDKKPRQDILLRFNCRAISSHLPLKKALKGILRAGENEVRRMMGVRNKLKVEGLNAEMERFIQSYFCRRERMEYQEQCKEEEEKKRQERKIQINWNELNRLQVETENVISLLETGNEMLYMEDWKEHEKQQLEQSIQSEERTNPVVEEHQHSLKACFRAEEQRDAKQLDAQSEENEDHWQQWPVWQTEIVTMLIHGKEREAEKIAVENGSFLDLTLDDMNAFALECWGEMLFEGREVNILLWEEGQQGR